MFGSPDHTAYDLKFRLLDIPVRVHPLFWLIMAMLGGMHGQPLRSVLIFIACAFVSILVHEFGHGLSSRWLGREPGGIVLYSMGGFCYYDYQHQAPWKRVVVLLSGPGAGFGLFSLVLVALKAGYGIDPMDSLASIGVGNGSIKGFAKMGPHLSMPMIEIIQTLLWINLWWGLFNLLPIWPLDGGQITATVLGALNPVNGVRWGHVVSLLTAGGFAVWAATRQDYMSALWVGSFAFMNYQILQTMHDSYRSTRDSDWGR